MWAIKVKAFFEPFQLAAFCKLVNIGKFDSRFA